MNVPYPSLFQPFQIGPLLVNNRLAVSPMTRISAEENGVVGPLMCEYYERFAAGGFGLIITEGLYTDERYSQGYYCQAAMATQRHCESWKPVVKAVHEQGSKFIAQIMHAGGLAQFNSYTDETVGPSAVQPLGEQMPFYHGTGAYTRSRALTEQDIRNVIEGFTTAALNARSAGFDGVEIHGANGYLLDQFLTVYTNHRGDQYGGPLENRLRIYQEVIESVRRATEDDFVLGVRFSQKKVNDASYTWPEGEKAAETIFSCMQEWGVDYIHTTEPMLNHPAFEGSEPLARLAKKYSHLPVIANGGIHDPQDAQFALKHDHGDMIALGKGALANPDWPLLVKETKPLRKFDFAMLSPVANLDNAKKYFASST